MTQVPVSQSIYEFTMGSGRGNPVVYLDIAIGNDPLRRLRFELPITVENFRQLCTGEGKDKARKKMLWYKGSNIHRVVPGFMMQGGDITHGELAHPSVHVVTGPIYAGNGIGGSSASSRMFDDEGFMFKHMRGTLSMAHQANTNKSQFFVCFRECGWLNGKHVAFGQVIAEDLVYLKHFEDVGSSTGLPLKPIAIVHAGQLCGINFADATDMAQPGDENDGSNEDAAL